ncbi:hypothetical protein FCH28_19760 [Streptomyces piniterrae]|uniref:Uncharacterized protein n=1 Tax=Streptomyces piniterrae TaxID=2571125 RepID=A0A4U0NDL0_9ACTN|nr:hypothetical protein [Streptomyces piniterrae]TJZ52076.1 hypothetical protein FCH28_19760 [Streptomyces piniterrae]
MTRIKRTLVTVAIATAAAGGAATPAMADSHTPVAGGFTALDSHRPISEGFTTQDSHRPIPEGFTTQDSHRPYAPQSAATR